nr:hypothetical protein Itr_chr15CG12650 [Ipomoea trifida]
MLLISSSSCSRSSHSPPLRSAVWRTTTYARRRPSLPADSPSLPVVAGQSRPWLPASLSFSDRRQRQPQQRIDDNERLSLFFSSNSEQRAVNSEPWLPASREQQTVAALKDLDYYLQAYSPMPPPGFLA